MITVCIVGLGKWEEYTYPLILGIQQLEPEVNIVVVDNASEVPYPEHGGYQVVRTERVCYSEALNRAIESVYSDWYLILNNDVACLSDFAETIEAQDPGAIYGQQIIEEAGHVWLGMWLAVISREVWEKVGKFDVGFEMCGFEDADYCVRAAELGIPTKPIDLPFHHYWGKTRWDTPGYSAARARNIEYFAQKHGYKLGKNMKVTHA